jgi:nicotinate-nucleotide adenylyltransferase
LGGSFNPAHAGHLHISLTALTRLDLDQVWWLVSPQNPLKSRKGMAGYDQRFALARLLARDPRILVTDLEVQLGTRFTFDTLSKLTRYYPRTRFVWLMGADNLGQIHLWQRWRGIFANIPIAIFDRPPYGLRTLTSPAAGAFARYRLKESQGRALPSAKPPAWLFFPSQLEPMSSTQLRQAARSFGPDSLRTRFLHPTFREAGARAPEESRGTHIVPQIQQPAGDTPVTLPTARRTRTARSKTPDGIVPSANPGPSPQELKDLIVGSIDNDKGEDIVVVDLKGKSAIADFIVVATGRSGRQVAAMAEHLVEKFQPSLSFRIGVEGLPQGDWVLIDCGDVVVHLFRPEVRDFYAIEKMWGLEPPRFTAVAVGRP